jgi:hypothetical protein
VPASAISYVLNFGILGIVALALYFGLLYTKGYVDEQKERFAGIVADYEERLRKSEEEHAEEVIELKHALALERQRSDVGITAGRILSDLSAELRRELKQ